jgi:hypothetical protein
MFNAFKMPFRCSPALNLNDDVPTNWVKFCLRVDYIQSVVNFFIKLYEKLCFTFMFKRGMCENGSNISHFSVS